MRSENTADIDLAWDAGRAIVSASCASRRRSSRIRFSQKYKLWKDGEYYSANKLLTLQQSLVDADYFIGRWRSRPTWSTPRMAKCPWT